MPLVEVEVEIVNLKGMHMKAAGHFRRTAARFKSEISVSRDNMTVSAKSIIGLLGLQASRGASIEIRAEGEDAEEAAAALVKLISDRFGEKEEDKKEMERRRKKRKKRGRKAEKEKGG
jgi:phosphocarrier protein